MTKHAPRSGADEALQHQGGLTLSEAATFAGVSLHTLRRAIDAKELDARYPSSRPVVLREELDRWLRRGALNLDQAAAYCGISRRTLNRIVARGDLTPRWPSGRPVLLRGDLDDWLRNLPSEPPAEAAA